MTNSPPKKLVSAITRHLWRSGPVSFNSLVWLAAFALGTSAHAEVTPFVSTPVLPAQTQSSDCDCVENDAANHSSETVIETTHIRPATVSHHQSRRDGVTPIPSTVVNGRTVQYGSAPVYYGGPYANGTCKNCGVAFFGNYASPGHLPHHKQPPGAALVQSGGQWRYVEQTIRSPHVVEYRYREPRIAPPAPAW